MSLLLPSSGLKITLKMGPAGSSQTSVNLCHHTSRRHIQQDSILHSYARENLNFCTLTLLLHRSFAELTGLTNYSLSVPKETISI
jgi:hypothetical protein